MFGRRRRPVLATAMVVGVSRSAARHEVAAHAQQQQYDQMAMELQRRDEEDRERRTQAAIDEAIAKERLRHEQTQPASLAGPGNPPVYSSAPADAKAARYCRQCGYGCGSADRFCVQCGCKVEETT